MTMRQWDTDVRREHTDVRWVGFHPLQTKLAYIARSVSDEVKQFNHVGTCSDATSASSSLISVSGSSSDASPVFKIGGSSGKASGSISSDPDFSVAVSTSSISASASVPLVASVSSSFALLAGDSSSTS